MDTAPTDASSSTPISPTPAQMLKFSNFMAWRDNTVEEASPSSSSTLAEMQELPTSMSLGDNSPSDAASSSSATLPEIQEFPNSYSCSLFNPIVTQKDLHMLFPPDNDEASGSTWADFGYLDPLQEDLVEPLARSSVSTQCSSDGLSKQIITRLTEALEKTNNQIVELHKRAEKEKHSTQPCSETHCTENLNKYEEECLLLSTKHQILTKQLDECISPDKPI